MCKNLKRPVAKLAAGFTISKYGEILLQKYNNNLIKKLVLRLTKTLVAEFY